MGYQANYVETKQNQTTTSCHNKSESLFAEMLPTQHLIVKGIF